MGFFAFGVGYVDTELSLACDLVTWSSSREKCNSCTYYVVGTLPWVLTLLAVHDYSYVKRIIHVRTRTCTVYGRTGTYLVPRMSVPGRMVYAIVLR